MKFIIHILNLYIKYCFHFKKSVFAKINPLRMKKYPKQIKKYHNEFIRKIIKNFQMKLIKNK